MLAPVCRPLPASGDGFRRAGRPPAVGRIDDQRGPLVGGQLDPPLVPELVVRQDAALGPRPVEERALLRIEEVAVAPRPLRRLEGRRLLRREVLHSLELSRPLQRGQRAEGEGPGDVRLAVGGAHRHGPLGRLSQRGRRGQCQEEYQGAEGGEGVSVHRRSRVSCVSKRGQVRADRVMRAWKAPHRKSLHQAGGLEIGEAVTPRAGAPVTPPACDRRRKAGSCQAEPRRIRVPSPLNMSSMLAAWTDLAMRHTFTPVCRAPGGR